MRIFYGGTEAPTMRKRAANAGVTRFAVSFYGLKERLPVSGEFPFAERFPENAEILLDSGAFSLNRKMDEIDGEYWSKYLDAYIKIVGESHQDLRFITELDFAALSVDDLWALREDVWAHVPVEKFLPVWHPKHGFDELMSLSESYPQVALPPEAVKEVGQRLTAVANRTGVRFHGMGIKFSDIISRAGFSTLSTTGWVSPHRHGDRVIWDGGSLHRYGKKDQERFVAKHRTAISNFGVDPELILARDAQSLADLTVLSYESFAEHISRVGIGPKSNGVTDSGSEQTQGRAESPNGQVVSLANQGGKTEVVSTGERKLLPVVGFVQKQFQDEDGNTQTSGPQMRVPSKSARKCDTCYIRSACPEFEPGSDCKFDIPVEIKTKDQLTAMLTGMLELQTQRALFARYAEELEGGYPSETVSAEFDRLMKMTQTAKDIQDDRDFMEVHIKAKAQGGVISRLFGDQAGQKARELDRPVSAEATDSIMAEVLDVEAE